MLVNNFTYCVEYETNRSTCSGNCDWICRCTTVDPEIISVDYGCVSQTIISSFKKKFSDIMKYSIDRYVRKLLTIDSFIADGVPGYYGEEVEVYLSNFETFSKSIEELLILSDSECIEKCLVLEYGYLLDSLCDKNWVIKEKIDINLIHSPYCKVDQGIVDSYTGHEYVICVPEDGINYKLIDGNHRFAAAKKNNNKKMSIITYEQI